MRTIRKKETHTGWLVACLPVCVLIITIEYESHMNGL